MTHALSEIFTIDGEDLLVLLALGFLGVAVVIFLATRPARDDTHAVHDPDDAEFAPRDEE